MRYIVEYLQKIFSFPGKLISSFRIRDLRPRGKINTPSFKYLIKKINSVRRWRVFQIKASGFSRAPTWIINFANSAGFVPAAPAGFFHASAYVRNRREIADLQLRPSRKLKNQPHLDSMEYSRVLLTDYFENTHLKQKKKVQVTPSLIKMNITYKILWDKKVTF